MAIHTERVSDIEGGISKGIEASAMDMAMETLQKSMYQFPIKSTVREIVCNGVDSVADRNKALDILINNAPISKYYADMEGAIYKDSHFQPEYYDPKWLSDDNLVRIHYRVGRNQEKDTVTITDNGTGLGGKRLEGYFQLYYSTKRLGKDQLGKYGIGAKSALSTGVPFYSMESRYNGKIYKFNIYSGTAISIVPAFNLETGESYEYDLLNGKDGKQIKAYWIPTTKQNGVEVTLEVKKHHKANYIDAVKSQLLYFDNLLFTVDEANSNPPDIIPYKAEIMYQDEHIVLSNNSQWSMPHILINRVNYGPINWNELELENKKGNIGIKVAAEDIEVNPSRESITWSDKTKAIVLQRYREVKGIATRIVQKQLNDTDIIKWLRVCYQISGNAWTRDQNTVLGRLANIIDISEVEPEFPGNRDIKFDPDEMFGFLNVSRISETTSRKLNKNIKSLLRETTWGLRDNEDMPLFVLDAENSTRKNRFLLRNIYPNGFLLFDPPSWVDRDFTDVVFTMQLVDMLGLDKFTKSNNMGKLKSAVLKACSIWQELKKSPDLMSYSGVSVPDTFRSSEKEEEIEEEEEEVAVEQVRTSAERRKLEGKIVLFTPMFNIAPSYNIKSKDVVLTSSVRAYTMRKEEEHIKNINNWNEEEVFYGHDSDIDLFTLASFITRRNSEALTNQYAVVNNYTESKVKLVKVSQDKAKLLRDFKHIRKFFSEVANNKLTMSNALVKWNTARIVHDKLHLLNFLHNMATISPEMYKTYKKLITYDSDNYREVAKFASAESPGITTDAYTDLLKHLDALHTFQEYVNNNNTEEDIGTLAKGLFGNSQITHAHAVDSDVLLELTDLLERTETIRNLLNQVGCLTGLTANDTNLPYSCFHTRSTKSIPVEVIGELHAYVSAKGVSLN